MVDLKLGVKKWRKKICWRIRFSAMAYLQKAPTCLSGSSENAPDSVNVLLSTKTKKCQKSRSLASGIFLFKVR